MIAPRLPRQKKTKAMVTMMSVQQSGSDDDLKKLSVKTAATKPSNVTSSSLTSYANVMMTLSAAYLFKNNAPIR